MTARVSAVGETLPPRVGAAQARRMADSARSLGASTRSSRLVLELLLRHTRGWVPVERSTAWIARQCGITHRSTRRGLDLLESLGLVELVRRGDGRTVAAYRVAVTRLTEGETRVNLSTVDPGESVPPGGSVCPPRGVSLSPQGGQFVPPVRARARIQFSTRNTPPPPSLPAPLPAPSDSPTDLVGGAPLKCPHGRTAMQGCRRCGTDSRTQARAVREQQRAEDRVARLARQLASRTPDPTLTPPPEDLRARIAAARERR